MADMVIECEWVKVKLKDTEMVKLVTIDDVRPYLTDLDGVLVIVVVAATGEVHWFSKNELVSLSYMPIEEKTDD